MADVGGVPNNLQLIRQAIPRPRFFLALLIGSVLVQFFISGLRVKTEGDATGRLLPKSVLVVTAHPDDEAMFFGPSVQGLSGAGVDIYALCLSTGNADGLGLARSGELYASYETLGLKPGQIKYLEDAQLQDGMDTHWDPNHVASTIRTHIGSLPDPVEAIVSFDWRGVSSHPNHVAAFNGSTIVSESSKLPLYILPSMDIWEKYNSIPFAVWETITYSGKPPDAHSSAESSSNPIASFSPPAEIHILSSPSQYLITVQAMLKHHTQLVWFRYLHLVFSRYMFANQLVLYKPGMELVEGQDDD
ncbi:LmbE-like protein [Testicularia cyperi]|uniref:N-acetylglucosaminylphosphatidylinositol deacetylase n=1 Tax=Testicularia cyperi TaxID=1882483 RepID=A0A317XWT1_9BASI|nr:LmbE-like protein [Testicularia cyperi]